MITRILHAVTRQLSPAAGEPGHFHPGPRGPYPCHDPECLAGGHPGDDTRSVAPTIVHPR